MRVQVALSLDEKSHVLYSNRCTAYIALDQYDKAMEDADECVRLQPSWAKGYLRRGSVFFRMNQLERAEQVLKEGLELDPTNDALKKELEAVMNAIAERMARQRESLEAKERAIEAFNEQNYKGAVDLLKKAIKLDPDNHIFFSNRAAAHMALEQYDRALVDADECIRLQPTWAKGYSRRGAALFRMDKLGPARDAFEKGLELDRDNPTYVRCTRQELQLVMDAIVQRKEESLEYKERAIEAFNVQNFKRAEQHLSSAIELDPENHVFFSNRAAVTAVTHPNPRPRGSHIARTKCRDGSHATSSAGEEPGTSAACRSRSLKLLARRVPSSQPADRPTWRWRSSTRRSRTRTSACGCSPRGPRATRARRRPTSAWASCRRRGSRA